MPMSDYMRDLRARVGHRLLQIPSVALAIQDAEGRVLLGRYAADGTWLLPGGAVEPLEEPQEAARREGLEETGYELELTGLLGCYGGPEFRVRYPNEDEISFVAAVYTARVCGGAGRPDGEELVELAWCDAAQASALEMPAWVRPVLADLFRA